MKRRTMGAVLVAALALGGCDLDMQDPNLPSEDAVLGTPAGIKASAIGLQAEYSNQIIAPIYVNGLIADEVGAARASFQNYQDLDLGLVPELDPGLGTSSEPWIGHYRVVKIANDLIARAPESGFGEGVVSGIIAMAKLYKAMAFGNLLQIFESIPIEVGPEHPSPVFVNRAEAVAEVLRLLNEARTQLQQTPASNQFRTEILAPGFDLENTIDAMNARYALIAGDYNAAIAAAQRVNPTVLSEFRFSANDPNPIWNMWYNSGDAYRMRPEQGFRLNAEPGDQRVAYWVVEDSYAGGGNTVLDNLARYTTSSDPIPVYLPDEMKLIQAEAHARLNQLPQARTLVNEVRTQCQSPVDEPVACLPARTDAELATQEAVLAEIRIQRRYELYLQALSWEDQRRLGPAPKYMWMPVPNQECDVNVNAPCHQAP